MQQKGLGLLLTGKAGSLQVLHHPGQQLAFPEKLPVPSCRKIQGEIGETARWGEWFFWESAFPRSKHPWKRLAMMLLLNLILPLGHLCLLPFFTRKNRQIMTLTPSGFTHLFCYVYRAGILHFATNPLSGFQCSALSFRQIPRFRPLLAIYPFFKFFNYADWYRPSINFLEVLIVDREGVFIFEPGS